MAQVSQDTLRLEIIREARDRYDTARKAKHTTAAEGLLYSLKIAECEAMLNEILQPKVECE